MVWWLGERFDAHQEVFVSHHFTLKGVQTIYVFMLKHTRTCVSLWSLTCLVWKLWLEGLLQSIGTSSFEVKMWNFRVASVKFESNQKFWRNSPLNIELKHKALHESLHEFLVTASIRVSVFEKLKVCSAKGFVNFCWWSFTALDLFSCFDQNRSAAFFVYVRVSRFLMTWVTRCYVDKKAWGSLWRNLRVDWCHSSCPQKVDNLQLSL